MQPMEIVILKISEVVAGVSGIVQSQPNPKEKQNVYPFAITYPADGDIAMGATGTRKSLDNIVVEVMKSRVDLPRDLAAMVQFYDTVPAALIAEVSGNGNRFDGTISTFGNIRRQFVPGVDYAGVILIGYRFIMQDVKILIDTS